MISAHHNAGLPFQEYFDDLEAIFRAHGGRPHWAKRHTLTARDVEALYPDAARFRMVRDAHDPEGKFANAHLGSLFGLERSREAA